MCLHMDYCSNKRLLLGTTHEETMVVRLLLRLTIQKRAHHAVSWYVGSNGACQVLDEAAAQACSVIRGRLLQQVGSALALRPQLPCQRRNLYDRFAFQSNIDRGAESFTLPTRSSHDGQRACMVGTPDAAADATQPP